MNKDAASAATKRRFGRSQPTSLANAPSELLTTRKVALFALGRLKPGEMNRTEQAYAQHLELRKQAGEVAWFRFEGVKLRLADNTFYTPDFFVMLANGELEAHEVKGFMRDDANVKLKVASASFPLRFYLIKARAKKDGGGWDVEAI